MPIICTACGHRRTPQDGGSASVCPLCQTPYTAAAIRDQTAEPPPPLEPTPISVAWPRAVRVNVVEFDISFLSMIWLFFKAAIAIIPAGILVVVAWLIFWASIGGTLRL